VPPQHKKRFIRKFKAIATEGRTVSLAELSMIALVIGVVAGGSAVLFRAFIALVHNAIMLGRFSFYYNPNLHTQPSWIGPLVILSPVAGGIVVVTLIRLQAPDRRGQGVSDVIDAIYYRDGRVRSVSAIAKSLAAGIESASGGSVGREAAMVQIAAALASRIARITRVAQWQRMTLVAAGAAAGLAAAFNAPLGSIVFAVELMLPEISPRTLLPVTVAAGGGTFVARFYFGQQPTFLVETVTASHLRISGILSLLPFAGFGIVLGFVGWLMIWGLGATEKAFARLAPNSFLRHSIGMLAVGLLGYGMMRMTGHYYIDGPSYAALQDILRGDITTAQFFLLLFAVKLIATTLTLGSGGSGGVFSASMVIGASLGGAVGAVIHLLWPGLDTDVTDFAIVGMAGLLGSTTGAPLTAIVMVFELTRDYNVIVPMILGVTLALAVRRAVLPSSIYTLKLVTKGHEVPDALHANMYAIKHAERAMATDFEVRPAAATLDATLASLPERERALYLIIADGERLKGYLRLDPGFNLWQARDPATLLGDLARSDYVLARPADPMSQVIGRLARRGGRLAIVVRGRARIPRVHDVLGLIARDTMGDAVIESLKPYSTQPFRNPLPLLYRRRLAQLIRLWRRHAHAKVTARDRAPR
jgi:CIC family chloride channel protein